MSDTTGNQQSNGNKLPKLIPSEDFSKAVVPIKKKPLKNIHTRIERYNVEQFCFRLFWRFSRNSGDIARMLNTHLDTKREALLKNGFVTKDFSFSRITTHDVKSFIMKYQKKVDRHILGRERRLMDEALDLVNTLKKLTANACETIDVWYNQFQDAVGKDDLKEMVTVGRMLGHERTQISQIAMKLAEITGKVKTYITVDSLHNQIRSIASIVEDSDSIDATVKISLIDQIQESIQLSVSQDVEEY